MADIAVKSVDLLIAQAFRAQAREHRRRGKHQVLSLEYFVAGVPPFQLLEMKLEDVEGLLRRTRAGRSTLEPVAELCLVGLAAYFEAYCKDLFAAVVNICPELLGDFVRRRDCGFTLAEVLHLMDGSAHRVGSVLSEHYDWGSAQSVNGLFGDLLRISPFSRDEAKKYSEFLNDRNLLVHHGGTYTFKYAAQKFPRKTLKRLVHWQSITVRASDVLAWIGFFRRLAAKTTLASRKSLERFVNENKVKLGKQRDRAMRLLDA